jgi:hypothetical protein
VDITSDGQKLNSDIKIVFVDGNKSDRGSEENESE